MPSQSTTCPMTYTQVVEAYFMEHRAKLIDVAAFLDRLDRSTQSGEGDFRIEAFNRAIGILRDGQSQRTRRMLELLSDHSPQPIDKAPMQGALGAAPLASGEQA